MTLKQKCEQIFEGQFGSKQLSIRLIQSRKPKLQPTYTTFDVPQCITKAGVAVFEMQIPAKKQEMQTNIGSSETLLPESDPDLNELSDFQSDQLDSTKQYVPDRLNFNEMHCLLICTHTFGPLDPKVLKKP